jgi:hypothetical protein
MSGTGKFWTPRTVFGLVFASALGLLSVFFLLRESSENGNAQTLNNNPPSPYFRGWGTPDMAIVLSGQMHGYLQPCGCSDPQKGGLSRRYNFIQSLKTKGWPVVAVDVGDLAPKPDPDLWFAPPAQQKLLKYETAMKALELMKYSAIGLGKTEFDLPLFHALAYSSNHPKPRILAGNLKDDFQVVGSWTVAETTPSVGIVGIIGAEIIDEVKKYPDVKFAANNAAVLNKALQEVAAARPELVVLLFQGKAAKARKCASICAQQHKNGKGPVVNVLLRLDDDDMPSGEAQRVDDTMVIGMGHKGSYVGVVGAFRNKATGAFDLKYQLMAIGPEYETLPGKDKENPVIALMEEYSLRVKAENYLAKVQRNDHPLQVALADLQKEAKYVGSERCGQCHSGAHYIWEKSKHAGAFAALEKAKRPSLRQFDAECVACHVVGFPYKTGYADPANTAKLNARLTNVGCESCHGPGSIHADGGKPSAANIFNPFKAQPNETPGRQKQRLNQLDEFCMKCHNIDNDVHWGKVPFHDKWDEISHSNAKAAKYEKDAP